MNNYTLEYSINEIQEETDDEDKEEKCFKIALNVGESGLNSIVVRDTINKSVRDEVRCYLDDEQLDMLANYFYNMHHTIKSRSIAKSFKK